MSDSQNASSTFGLGNYLDKASVFGASQLPDALGLVQSKLQQAAASHDLFAQVFGDKANTAEIQAVRSQWSVGDFSQLPSVQVLSADNMNGAFGAYASSTQTVYLSDTLFQSNAAPTDSLLGVVGVLVEETFHWLDDRVGADTAGDEGELAKDLLFGVSLSNSELARIKSEEDYGFITDSGLSKVVEFSSNSFTYGGKTYQWTNYTIRSGDTLSGIAQRTLSDGSANGYNFIAQRNGISNPSKINIGQLIQVPQLFGGINPTPTPIPTGYYRELNTFSESQWDQQSGDDNQFRPDSPFGGGDQRWKTDDRIEQIYTDLSNSVFGYRVQMTAGYAYDQSYYNGFGKWHAGLDMGASNGATIKAAIGGSVAWVSGSGDGNIFVGINSDDGRQWVYGHLKSASGLTPNKRINAGATIGLVGAQNHLHLEVQNGHAYGGTQGAMTDRNRLLNATVSPLMAYWQWRNKGATVVNPPTNNPVVNPPTNNFPTVSSNNWKAEFFNNTNLSGSPVLVQDLGSGSQNFSRNWGYSSPSSAVSSDNFSARVTTQRYFAPGTYQIQTTSDDGVRVRINNQTIIDKWIDQASTNHFGTFTTTGGNFNVSVEYYERGGAANLNFFAYSPVGGSIGDFYKSLGGADSSLGLSTSNEIYESNQITVRRSFQKGDIVHNRLTGENEAVGNGEQPSWQVYERMAKEFIYPPTDINSYNGDSFRAYGYEVDRVIENRSTGLFALGLQSIAGTRPPLLVFRGTDVTISQYFASDFLSDINPDGVGRDQFDTNKSDILAWIDRARSLWGRTPDVIGHSLGGALAQRTATEWTDRVGKVITFNSPGVGTQNARDFELRGGLNKTVVHYQTQFDAVASGGEKLIAGKVIEISGKDPSILFRVGKQFALTYLGVLLGTAIAGKSTLDNHLDSSLVSSGRTKRLLSTDEVNNSSLRQFTEKFRQGLGTVVRTGVVSSDVIRNARLGSTWAIELTLNAVLKFIRF